MTVKAAESSLSIRKGMLHARNIFVLRGKHSMARGKSTPKPGQMGKLAKQQLAKGLARLEQSLLPGKHKVLPANPTPIGNVASKGLRN